MTNNIGTDNIKIKLNKEKSEQILKSSYLINKNSKSHQTYVNSICESILHILDGKDISHYEQEKYGAIIGIKTKLEVIAKNNSSGEESYKLNIVYQIAGDDFIIKVLDSDVLNKEILKYDSYKDIDVSEIMRFIIKEIDETLKLSQYYILSAEDGLWSYIGNNGELIFDVELEMSLENERKRDEGSNGYQD